jgi:hypothetical protein
VTVNYIPGRQALLTIYEDNGTDIRETVTLSEIPTKAEMHQLMVEKGFVLKDEKELTRIAQEQQVLQELEDYHTYRRSMYFREQKELVEKFKDDVIYGPNMPARVVDKPKQSRQGREPDYLLDHYDMMHAEERFIARSKFDPEQALADHGARQGQIMHRYLQKRLKSRVAKQDREEL